MLPRGKLGGIEAGDPPRNADSGKPSLVLLGRQVFPPLQCSGEGMNTCGGVFSAYFSLLTPPVLGRISIYIFCLLFDFVQVQKLMWGFK